MSDFLSEEWFEALAARLAAAEALPGDSRLALGQLVRLDDGTERGWTVILQGGSPPRLVPGSTADAEVVLVSDLEDARALASGERTAAQLLEAGALKIRGDARRLVAEASLVEAFAGLAP